jgi:type II secretory pathway pseudopilin PulG
MRNCIPLFSQRRCGSGCLHRDERGMSVLELLVAVFIGSLVIYAGLETFVTMNRQTIWQDQITEAQQSGRAVQRILSQHLRMAGFGIPRILDPIWGADSDPDTLVITHQDPSGCEAFLSLAMSGAAEPLVCTGSNLACFAPGMWVYVHDPAVDSGEFFQVSQILDGPPTLVPFASLTRPYALGAGVYHVQQLTYYIDQTDDAHPTLMEKTYGGPAVPFAEDIEDLQFSYIMQSGDTVDLMARTPRVDEDVEHDYRRRPLSFNVSVRNLEF